MDFIGRMIDEENATKRIAFFLFIFVPGFWAIVFLILASVFSIASLFS